MDPLDPDPYTNLKALPCILQNPDTDVSEGAQTLSDRYTNFQRALLSTFLVSFEFEDARNALDTMWPAIAIILMCIFNFLLLIVMLNMIITLMADLYKAIKDKQDVVFLRNRAGAARPWPRSTVIQSVLWAGNTLEIAGSFAPLVVSYVCI